MTHLVVIGGTHVAWQGQPLLQAAGASNFFEWSRPSSMMNASSSEVSVTPWFEQLTGGISIQGPSFSSAEVNNISPPYAEKH
jgi:fatty acid desaturase